MKSERSQLHESDLLADKIEQKFAQIKPFLPALLGLIGVTVLGLLIYGIYTSQKEARAARAWTDFYFSDTSPQDLEAIAKDFSDTSAGIWARLTAGDANMSKALEKWNLDRTLADQYFKQAAEEYKGVAGATEEPFAKSRALFGAAQAYEGLGERKEAILEYRKLINMTGIAEDLASEAKRRLTWLETSEGETFYAWYRERRSVPAPTTNPSGLPDLPGLPNFSFPPAGSVPGIPPASSATPAAEPAPAPASEPAPATEPAPVTEPAPAAEPAPATPPATTPEVPGTEPK